MIRNKEIIRENVLAGENLGFYSHVIVYEDISDDSCKFYYVDKGYDINSEIGRILLMGCGKYKILETYSYYRNVEEQLTQYESYYDQNSLEAKALEFATRMHAGQTRFDGTPYVEHPKRVANYVKKYKAASKHLDILVAAALLHDTLEDTCLTFYDLVEFFGPQIASIVLELTTDEDLKKEVGKTRYLEIKLHHMSSWVLVIKLCDRLDNIQDLRECTESFRDKYVKETLEIVSYLLDKRGNRLSSTHKAILRDILAHIYSLRDLLASQDTEKLQSVMRLLLVRN